MTGVSSAIRSPAASRCCRVLRALFEIALERRPQGKAARAFVEAAHIHQHAPHIGMHDDRVRRASRVLRAR